MTEIVSQDERKFEILTTSYCKNDQIPSNCNDIAFTNTGTASVTIDTFPLPNFGDTKSHIGNANEINVHVYKIQFGTTGTPQLMVERKVYK